MHNTKKRTTIVACAFLATVFAVTVGATGRESPANEAADAGQLVAQAEIKTEAPVTYAGKGDLLHRPVAPIVPTVTVETRGNGVSVLRRVQLQSQN